MSRTDVHRPFAVQQADPHNRRLLYRFQMWATEAPVLVPWKNLTCGCAMCTGQFNRRSDRRRDRHSWRRNLERYG